MRERCLKREGRKCTKKRGEKEWMECEEMEKDVKEKGKTSE